MIHEWKSEFFNIPIKKYENFILRFDDGLYSQYLALDFLKKINTTKIFFISTGIIQPENKINDESIIPCNIAHERARQGIFDNFMKWSHIAEIHNTPQCIVGGHGNFHLDLRNVKLRKRLDIIKTELKMFDIFENHNIQIRDFCFPYNYECEIYKAMLSEYGILNFFGTPNENRIAIEDF